IYGLGVVNDRGLMATFLTAAKAIKDSGAKLKGDLILTAVVGEIGMSPVDEYQGGRYFGKGSGAQQLVNQGVTADYALVAEASRFAMTWMENGAGYYKITVKGVGGIYTPHIQRPVPLEENPNAVVRMSKVVQALEEWAFEYEQKNRYEFELGVAVPRVNIGAIRGGLAYKPSKTVGMCCLYVDVRIPPDKHPMSIKRDLEGLLKNTGIDGTVELYMFRRGYEGKNIEVLRDAIARAHFNHFGEKPPQVASVITSVWRDINVFNQVGIPAITYGPALALTRDGVEIDDFVTAAKLYVAIALDICNQTPRY
ncbi:MAG: M20/M25/M40 family metallo-hydrolase, partial [Desulfobacterales bacterium]|nr:M20/M25/M40 family metallo-hydrolase [Desulfobacterales bacterium]